jgi:hypothetical protein
MSHTHPLRRPTSSSVNPSAGTSHIGHVHASCADPCATTGHMSAHLTHTRRVTARVVSDTKCNTPASPWPGPVTPGSSLGSLDCPHRPTLVFSVHFVLTCAHPGTTSPVGHPSSNCSRPSTLNLEFFSDELLEKKVYLVDMSILSIILSPRPGCHRGRGGIG